MIGDDVAKKHAAAARSQHGHNVGTGEPAPVATQGLPRRAVDATSTALPAWPRLMPLDLACRYVGLSADTLLGFVADGSLRVTRPQRPQTPRARGYRQGKSRRTIAHVDTLRMRLFDRVDLDALVDAWKREGCA